MKEAGLGRQQTAETGSIECPPFAKPRILAILRPRGGSSFWKNGAERSRKRPVLELQKPTMFMKTKLVSGNSTSPFSVPGKNPFYRNKTT